MINVKLLFYPGNGPNIIASHAAKMCYQAEPPEIGNPIDVENKLFKTGHHTTLQHANFTFQVEGISIGDITFGFHLASPFYNSDQRSGRFCSKMFLNPDLSQVRSYIETFWPGHATDKVMEYIARGIDIYKTNVDEATYIAEKFIAEERPKASEKYIKANGAKFAQEQMRMFIPVIFPTGFDITLNLTALIALYETAWTPAMKFVTSEMVELVKAMYSYSDFSYMFSPARRRSGEWAMDVPQGAIWIENKPMISHSHVDYYAPEIPKPGDLHPVDHLHFMPEYMDNSIGEITSNIMISIATMGQDQRHRTIRRSKPRFADSFYLPPIPSELGLETSAKELMHKWQEITQDIPSTLAMILAPYGAMVIYTKKGSFNAIIHEQAKRLCWCAQEEIYHLSNSLREQVVSRHEDLVAFFEPPCMRSGICAEGDRYCGRDFKNLNLFQNRRI